MTVLDSFETTATSKRDCPPSMVERMTLILDAFDSRSTRLTLEEVACRTGLPRSTVHRILDQLVRLNWVEHASFGYCLGRRALGFGGDDGMSRLRSAAAPILHDLAMRTGVVVHLMVLDGGDAVYLDKIGGRFAATLPSQVGSRVPAHSTAGGKAILAWHEPEDVDAAYNGRLTRCTDRTIADLATLHQELNRIRNRHGVAFERGESVRGIACVGAAVRGPDGPVAGISVCGEAKSMQLERIAPLVGNAAREVARDLFPEMEEPRKARRLAKQAPKANWSPESFDRMVTLDHGQWL